MNDFTKEQLEFIQYCIRRWRGDFGAVADLDFINKIQSLIDNYCEHKETECIGGWVRKCTKCCMKFGDETQ